MIEDRRNRPSRGEPDPGTARSGPPGYPGWPSAGHAPDADDQPTDIYAALSDLAPGDAEPVPHPDHGQPVPRDFVPPQITWTPAPEPIEVRRSPEPERYDGSRVPWSPVTEPVPQPYQGPHVPQPRRPERYDGSRVPWSPASFDAFPDPAASGPAASGLAGPGPAASDVAPPVFAASDGGAWDGAARSEPFDVPRLQWTPEPAVDAPGAPIDRFEQRREDWRPDRPPTAETPAVEWAPAAGTEVFDQPMIDLSASRPLPVTHRGRRRRTRTVVAVAALGAVLAGGTGYAVLRGLGLGPATRTDASVPLVTATPRVGLSVPADAPADPVTVPSSAGRRQSTSPSPARTTPATTAAAPTGGTGTAPLDPAPTAPSETATASPLAARPDPPATSPDSAGPLIANLRYERASAGFLATVTLTNPGDAAVTGWTVRVTLAGATQVAVVGGGVSAARSGDTLVFTPASGAGPIVAGGTLTFAFAASGSAGSPPSGCQVDGTPCS